MDEFNRDKSIDDTIEELAEKAESTIVSDNPDTADDWQTVKTVMAQPSIRNIDYRFDDSDDYDIMNDDELSDVVNEDEPSSVKAEKKPKRKKSGTQLIVQFQLIVFLVLVLAIIIFKNVGNEYYDIAYNWYVENINNSLIVTEVWNWFSP